MFMVASSVVLTVVVLNYHHRTADIHEMPNWVSSIRCTALFWSLQEISFVFLCFIDTIGIPNVATVDFANASTR